MIKDKLQIYIITYNRRSYIERTLKQLLAENSPVKDCDITILDNHSTDGTSEMIEEYCKQYKNLKHIRHVLNIGGNANVVKSFELAKINGKEYFWGLCDDDNFDFSNWTEVENLMSQKKDIICVSNYAIHYDKSNKTTFADTVIQMTFFPAGIYRTDLIEKNVLMNMYNSISDCMPHLCATIHAINEKKEIAILSKPVVFNGLHTNSHSKESSYTRGASNCERTARFENATWILAFVNVLYLLQNNKLRKELLVAAILHNDVLGSWDCFYKQMFYVYYDKHLFSYLYEIFSLLPFRRTVEFLCKAIFMKFYKKKESYTNKEDWVNYFERRNFQKKIDKLSKKYRGKKILLYGNGMISQILQESYDLSKLNIVAITDKKYLGSNATGNNKYNIVPPNKLDSVNYDVIFIALKQSKYIKSSFVDKGIKKEIIRLV